MNRFIHRRPQGILLAAVAGLVLGSLVACSADEGPTSGPTPPGATSAPSSGPSPAPTSTDSPTPAPPGTSSPRPLPDGVSTARPKDPVATGAVQQVSRDGKKPNPSIDTTAGQQPFDGPVEYGDGIRLDVTDITHGTMSGHGPGVYPGRATTTFELTLANDTSSALELGVVVVTVTYGSPARVAHHIYDDASLDFRGSVSPGKSTTAVYGFSIPDEALDEVTLTVDIDGQHQLAVFRGSVKE